MRRDELSLGAVLPRDGGFGRRVDELEEQVVGCEEVVAGQLVAGRRVDRDQVGVAEVLCDEGAVVGPQLPADSWDRAARLTSEQDAPQAGSDGSEPSLSRTYSAR